MRAGILAAVGALTLSVPAHAGTIIHTTTVESFGKTNTIHLSDYGAEWVRLHFSQPIQSIQTEVYWFVAIGNSFCDETMTEYCFNNYADGNGVLERTTANSKFHETKLTRKLDGWFAETYVTDSYLTASGFTVSFQKSSFDPVKIMLTFGSGAPEPTTWALMILGFVAVGGAMRRRARSVALA